MKQWINLVLVITFICYSLPTKAEELTLQSRMELVASNLPADWASEHQAIETSQERESRLKTIVEAITQETQKNNDNWFWSKDDLAWAVFVKAWNESSRFSLAVHQGKFRGDHGHSVCLGQIWDGGKSLIGTDLESTKKCINKIIFHLTKHQNRCLNKNDPPNAWNMAKVFAGYGSGYSCNASIKNKDGQKWALQRAFMWEKLRKDSYQTFLKK